MSKLIETTKENENFVIKVGEIIDTNNVGAIQEEVLEAISDLDQNIHLIFDCSDLKYISSAGLRMIMMVLKQHKDMELINVSLVPYDVFEVTGMTQMLPVSKKRREIDITNLERIGAGQTGSTYRVNPETIVKVFLEGISEDIINEEREIAQKAFVEGIPTAIPFDTVKVGNQLGIVYELIPSSTFLGQIVNDKENLDKYALEYGKFLHDANSIKLDSEKCYHDGSHFC